MLSQSSKEAADAQFKKVQKAQEGANAMAEYQANAQAVRERTAKLRELRLAKEAAEQATVRKAPAAKGKSAKAKKAAAVPLSDWLEDQERSGRRS